jgi:hypothetical protein
VARGQASNTQAKERSFVFHFPHYQIERGSTPMSAIRVGNLKLVHFYETGVDRLFDLNVDLEEARNLAPSRPARVRELLRGLRDYLKEVDASMPRLNPARGAGKLPDVDQDGLNDDWEFRELLTTKYSASDDPDQDGQSNATEFANHTDPL